MTTFHCGNASLGKLDQKLNNYKRPDIFQVYHAANLVEFYDLVRDLQIYNLTHVSLRFCHLTPLGALAGLPPNPRTLI